MAILDTMKLVHLGSTVMDERLLAEGRKRFLVAMNCLRFNVGLKDPKMANVGLMMVSQGISLSEVWFSSFASLSNTLLLYQVIFAGGPTRSSDVDS